jgi:hypothetical protein
VGGYAPRAREDSMRPRRLIRRALRDWRASFDLSAARDIGRPLNFTVRRRLRYAVADSSARTPLPPSERIWSPRQITVAAFLGSPLAAAWFFSRNFLACGDEVRSRRSLWVGLRFTALILAVAYLLPARFPAALVALIYTPATELYAVSCFKSAYEKHIAEGWVKGSWWSVVGVSVASCLLLIALGVTVVVSVARWTGAQIDWDLRSPPVPSTQVTVADLPHVLIELSKASRTPAYAELVFTTPDRPSRRDAIHLRLSLENGHPGVDWVLIAPRNIEDKASFVGFVSRRGYSFSERTTNGISYLRIEDGDLVQLCTDVVTKLYVRLWSEPIGLTVEGFEWVQ